MKSKYLPCWPCISDEHPPGLNLKVKCVMMVKYDSTMSWQPCSEAFFRICQAVVADPMELCTEVTRQQPLHHQHGVTLSGRRALPDCRYVWNPSSFTLTSSVNVNIVWCSVRLPLRPEARSLILIKSLNIPNQVVSNGWSKVPISYLLHCTLLKQKRILTEM